MAIWRSMNAWLVVFGLGFASALVTFLVIALLTKVTRLNYRWCAALGWIGIVVPSSLFFWLSFVQADAEAAAASGRSIAIYFFYGGLWIVASLAGPVFGLMAYLRRHHFKAE